MLLPPHDCKCRTLEYIEANHTQIKIPLDFPERFAADTSFSSKPQGSLLFDIQQLVGHVKISSFPSDLLVIRLGVTGLQARKARLVMSRNISVDVGKLGRRVTYSAGMCQRRLDHETACLARAALVLGPKGWPQEWKGAPAQQSVCPHVLFLSGRTTASGRMAFLRM